MVTRDYITKSALRCDTVMSRAFLRALGIPVSYKYRGESIFPTERIDDIEWCFENHGSPMDWR